MMFGLMILDGWWWMMIPGLVLGLYAQMRLSSAYGRYLGVAAMRGVTGAGAAREILDEAGLRDVPVEEVPGHLTDHYDPTKRALFLSSENFRGNSISAVGVAAHEAGHALQHKARYAPMTIRQTLVPATQFASNAIYGMFFLSFLLNIANLATIAVVAYGVLFLFQFVTLPVEFDASRRAKEQLVRLGLIDNREHEAVNKVLGAAALTYVAAMIYALLELLHWILILRNNNRN
jgi:Zn-dependent membrane protease YugP